MQSGNPYQGQPAANVPYQNSAPVHAYPTSTGTAQPNSAVLPINPMNASQLQHKRPLNSPEEIADPHWKRVRFEGSGAQPSGVQAQYSGAAPTAQHHAVRQPVPQQPTAQQPVAYQSAYQPTAQYPGVQHGVPQQQHGAQPLNTAQHPAYQHAPQQPMYQHMPQHSVQQQPVAQYPGAVAQQHHMAHRPAVQAQVQQQRVAQQPAQTHTTAQPAAQYAATQHTAPQQPTVQAQHSTAANLLQQPQSKNNAEAPTAAKSAQPAQEARPEDFPVVEALVRRDGTDKLRRVQVDGTLNAVERAEVGLDEKKKICPKAAVDQVIAGLGADEDFVVDDDVKSALGLLAENMLEDTMEFGALMASRRNSKWLQAKDLECYLERTWHIFLPGFSSRCVTAAPKTAVESTDMKNKASVRNYLAQLPVQQPSDGVKKEAGNEAGGS